MIVYHGSVDVVEKPLAGIGRSGLDFGRGFYITDIREQASTWARKIAARFRTAPILNIYDLDIATAANRFRYIRFDSYDVSWLDFIASNRQGGTEWEQYDLIEGGVADDRVVDTVESYISGLISADAALARLKHFKPNNQLCITSQQLIDDHLAFVESLTLETE